MTISLFMNQRIRHIFPDTLTILTTYRCNAECRQCCFESNPKIEKRLSLDVINKRIEEAYRTFPALKLIVFSGGETFLLKDDLYSAIKYANSLGLMTRCVTNGFWGKTIGTAKRTVQKLVASGINEINISTGSDHQKWVPFESIENAAQVLVESGVFTLVTVERDSEKSNCYERAANSVVLKKLLQDKPLLFTLQCNSWMPFHDDYEQRGAPIGIDVPDGCSQIFHNLVVTPHDQLAACCGLTFEHIPEMKLGTLGEKTMDKMFNEALDDFLKIWIHLDGPTKIMKKLFDEEVDEGLSQVHHICQACAIMHLHTRVRETLKARYTEFLPDVLSRFSLKIAMRNAEKSVFPIAIVD
ncbi:MULTISPECIES: radical SAM protein [unclassified Undibacterium]|uniref:radical SAM protein n=1 Tax=unclassified Undibacterium TaxID=2630295 RepID=UPI002AC8F6D5|nr:MULTISPECIES: radical SAM protein [unclassified Undibacterium]MEB0141092.1 radical SAM protein [Undibacterium sp. CCC2.1]MEB0174103.1 radical SAM protein [Undibacterium sp. CCC1.1]MEB0178072.1 radical SAM protein [Undibacterium sp. CCC3.4]MEB0217263.1 radical SAM protein [Undibacterium sp. 5I2]WPX43766.1 radical SAM protein [Undibacterium sp. CCC3.4]